MKNFLFPFFLLIGTSWLFAQNGDLALRHNLYHYLDRVDIRGYTGKVVHTEIKPYGRNYLASVLRQADTSAMGRMEKRWHLRARLLVDDSLAEQQEKGAILRYFYRNGRDLFHHRSKDFEVYVNPAFRFQLGGEQQAFSGDPFREVLFTNSRGAVIRGSAFGKVGFYTEVYDNQKRFPQFVRNRYEDFQNLYGETFVKLSADRSVYDYFHARGYLTYQPFSGMRIKFGHDRGFWGPGFQSLFFSDYAPNHLMLQVNTRIWKLEYTNYFAQLIDFIPDKPDVIGTFPRKYLSMHQLSYKPTPWLSIGVFESVVYAQDQASRSRGFELQYLNPLIFYRAIEQSLGSPDNGMLGFTGKLNLWKRGQVYGQLLIDDFNFGEFRQDPTYWGTKIGYQIGGKWIDFLGIRTLDLQAEYNLLRPYVYQHFNIASNYSHYGQYLGHSQGGNVKEFSLIARFHPLPAWNAQLRFTTLNKGLDADSLNFGGDIRISDQFMRPMDQGVRTGQGQAWRVQQVYGRLSYQLWGTDVYAEGEGRMRWENGVLSAQVLLGLRANLGWAGPVF